MTILTPDAPVPETSRVTQGPGAPGRTSDVRGVIDNLTPDRLYGWAWDHGHPEHRVRVLLRIAGRTLAEGVADVMRLDLLNAGIGDGHHAFELPIEAEVRDRIAEVTVVALGADGREFKIAARLPRREEAPAATPLQRVVEGVIAEQREMRRELAALREGVERQPVAEAPAPAFPAAEEIQARISHLELWLTRLDVGLADLVAEAKPPARTGVDPWQVALYVTLAGLSAAALAATAFRWLA